MLHCSGLGTTCNATNQVHVPRAAQSASDTVKFVFLDSQSLEGEIFRICASGGGSAGRNKSLGRLFFFTLKASQDSRLKTEHHQAVKVQDVAGSLVQQVLAAAFFCFGEFHE